MAVIVAATAVTRWAARRVVEPDIE